MNDLTARMDGCYYTLACDNLFTSPTLFQDLLQRGIYAMEIVRGYWVSFPNSLNVGDNEARGTLHTHIHRDRMMAATHWADCKGVCFMSTAANSYARDCVMERNTGGWP